MTTPTPGYAAAPCRILHAGPVKRCPTCRTPLDCGPVRFRCEACGRSVMAADLDTDYHPAESLGADALDSNPARTVPDGRRTA
ncbi:Uncharacterised protein [Mycobacterium tuberculosis]|nr:Uncharacterised protein [Mycobacterium tuberculosis]